MDTVLRTPDKIIDGARTYPVERGRTSQEPGIVRALPGKTMRRSDLGPRGTQARTHESRVYLAEALNVYCGVGDVQGRSVVISS
jgi:hypothetical protein